MLPKSRRLHTAADFRRLRGRGTVWRSPSFVALVKSNNTAQSRLGLIVSAKVGKAVKRKRASRILRHAFALALNPTANQDIVLIAKPTIKDKTTQDIHQELSKMVHHLKL